MIGAPVFQSPSRRFASVSAVVIDGEAVLLGIDGRSDFNGLHSRRHDNEVQLYAFDTRSTWFADEATAKLRMELIQQCTGAFVDFVDRRVKFQIGHLIDRGALVHHLFDRLFWIIGLQ
ncbi:hypothetical protein ACVIHF_000726 [Bradyrhizobium sp. USDA 4506]